MTDPMNELGRSGLGGRLAKKPTMVELVSGRILADIESGSLVPGARLPTEREMIAELGVSRTVIREAVAQLRANGIVTTRQGLGAFVAEGARDKPLRISANELKVVGDLIYLNELRLAIEVESAALAAQRGTAEQVGAIAETLAAIAKAIADGRTGAEEDFSFHRAIAQASGNPHFTRTLDFLGQYSVPRRVVTGEKLEEGYLLRLQVEHQAIYEAIHDGNVMGAQTAMRNHLGASLARLGRMKQQAL